MEEYEGLQSSRARLPTMKPLNDVNKKSDVKEKAAEVPENDVKAEPRNRVFAAY